tara:strand:- start:505 stop:1182 length:678 start_codon:yes stop_codon:yes gene_type:complete
MTNSATEGTIQKESISEKDVANFLSKNPDFFSGHEYLLKDLYLPHSKGDAVSLVERQILILRNTLNEQKIEKNKMIKEGNRNWKLLSLSLSLIKDLLNSSDEDSLLNALEDRFKSDFGADAVLIEIKTKTGIVGNGRDLISVFNKALKSKRPASGPVSQREKIVFESVSLAINSTVVLPLVRKNWSGIILLGSKNSDRYESGLNSEYLCFLRDIVALICDKFFEK